MAAGLFLVSFSYSFSDVLEQPGVTNNAIQNGNLTWDMLDVLPLPGGIMVNGVIYRYNVEKNPDSSFKVTIQNENADGSGYIFREVDDWSGVPGNTISKSLPLDNVPIEYFGMGSLSTEGEGEVNDPFVGYSYKLDPCFIPLTDPSCPGYLDALYDWLKENGLLSDDMGPNDPFYDELVQATLNRETELEDKDEKNKEENKEESEEIDKLNDGASIEALGDPSVQESIMQSLSTIPNFENYYDVKIQGGIYEETIILQDTRLPDNRRALSNLAQDSVHRSMVRFQYD